MNSLPELPDPVNVTGPESASDILSKTLVAVATASKQLTAVPALGQGSARPHLDWAAIPFKELEGWTGKLHKLLVAIAAQHACMVSWSVTVGTPFDLTLTVNFAKPEPDPDL